MSAISVDRWNLWCARDLPGSEGVDIEKIAATLDEWTEWIYHSTHRNIGMFHEDPAECRHSLATWCCYVILWCCQTRFGVNYRQEWREPTDSDDSRKLFVNGLVASPGRPATGGTCANIPVVYAAIARRLGYPLRLVRTFSHVWCRWDDPHGTSGLPADVFNVDGGEGFSWPDDDYFREHDNIDPIEEANGWYLKSLTPREELGSFHLERGHVLERNGRIHEAHGAFRIAAHLWRPGGRLPEEVQDCAVRTAALLGFPLIPRHAERHARRIEFECEFFGWEFCREERPANVDSFLPPLDRRGPLWTDGNGDEEPAREAYRRVREHHLRHGLNVTVYDVPALRREHQPVTTGELVETT